MEETFQVDVISAMLEAATISDFFHLFRQRNLILSGKSQGNSKTDVGGNHDMATHLILFHPFC